MDQLAHALADAALYIIEAAAAEILSITLTQSGQLVRQQPHNATGFAHSCCKCAKPVALCVLRIAHRGALQLGLWQHAISVPEVVLGIGGKAAEQGQDCRQIKMAGCI